jgi:hypothetical protein
MRTTGEGPVGREGSGRDAYFIGDRVDYRRRCKRFGAYIAKGQSHDSVHASGTCLKGGKKMEQVTAFQFMECATILKATGKQARTVRELRETIAAIGEESLFHHTCQYFLKGHILEYTNDFAHWVGESLEERALSERLSNVDPFVAKGMGELRKELLADIDDYLDHFPEPRAAVQGDEFYFNESVSMVFPTGLQARNLAEFLIAVRYVDPGSIYYHFYEARIRHGSDDFSTWVEDVLANSELAGSMRVIDPFMYNIERIRSRLVEAVEEDLRRGMEVMTS